jgi:alpha/beta hydrolase fold
MRVLFPEYRLAPEHPFPAAIDDVLTAWHWLRTEQDLPAASMAVAGALADGGLAADEGLFLIVCGAAPGSRDADALNLLASWNATDIAQDTALKQT